MLSRFGIDGDAATHNDSRQPERLVVTRNGVAIPACVWKPAGPSRGIVLACHGGSGHKQSPAIVAIASTLTRSGLAVLAIDGPVHGERRLDGDMTAPTAIASFHEAWRAGVGRLDIGEDFSAALDELTKDPTFAALPVGYIGVSMGTAYGIPLLARDRRIEAAAIGMWSMTDPESGHLADYARLVRCPVWFTQQWNDEYCDRAGTAALFDAIGSADKRLVASPGPHRALEGERLADATAFIAQRLLGTPAGVPA